MDEPRRIAALLRAQMHALETLLVDADEDDSARRAANGAWSVKETLSHLIGPPGDSVLEAIRRALIEDVPIIEIERGVTHLTADRRARSVDELLEAVTGQYVAVADLVEIAGKESLQRIAHVDTLDGRTGQTMTLAEFVGEFGDRHVAMHLEELRRRIAGD